MDISMLAALVQCIRDQPWQMKRSFNFPGEGEE